ncbi:cell wall hydrolase [Pelotomaculum schinkii]|nr:cell wall hydrolase [Pelotomaculum schinkii]
MKISKLMNHIRLDLMRLLKVCKRIKLEQLKIVIGKLCRQYDQTKMGICLAACVMLLPAALLLHQGAALQKIMKPVKEEQQIISAPPEELSGDVQQPAQAGRSGVPETSRGGQVDRASVNLLAQVIEGEAADEPYQGKVAVGAVILNRTESGEFPHTIPGVIYERDAFESVSNGQFQRPLSRDSMNAAIEALNGSDPTGGALYFWNPAKSSSQWVWSRPIVTQIGRHVFAR